MTGTVSVTFEYPTRPPDTYKTGPITAVTLATIIARGIREAKKEVKPHGPSSVVVVWEKLTERNQDED